MCQNAALCGNGLNLNQTIPRQNAELCCNGLITESIISMMKGKQYFTPFSAHNKLHHFQQYKLHHFQQYNKLHHFQQYNKLHHFQQYNKLQHFQQYNKLHHFQQYNKLNHFQHFKPLPNDTFLDWSKLKACEEDKINANKNLKFVL